MRASPQCHDLPLQPAHAVVLKFLHGLYVLVAGTDSRVHLLRILAQHRGARRADRPRSVTLESVSTCHPFCSGPCIRFGNPCIRNDNWQRLCSPLPPVPVPQPAQLSRKSATHSRGRRHRQPHASCAHPCTAPFARRCSSTAQLGSRTGFNLPSVLHRSMHMVPQQPARLITCHGQHVCKPLLPTRRTGMPRQDNRLSRAVRPSKPRSYPQPARHSAHQLANAWAGAGA
jgi:hypothetical protein